jgi:hypothetical protein
MRPIYIIICVLFLMACNEGRKPSTVDDNRVEISYNREKADSAREEIMQNAKEDGPSGTYSPSSRDDAEPEYDNMRGFDPASEDDMDDNGMSRYMENDDEEGWD